MATGVARITVDPDRYVDLLKKRLNIR